MTGPYRVSSAETCPQCKAAVLGGDRMVPRACAGGCGEWCDEGLVEKNWGDCVDIDGDPSRVINSAWVAHRCRAHGVWFVKDSRLQFERVHADDIERYQTIQGRVAAVEGHSRRGRA